jgi:hypothetical protein
MIYSETALVHRGPEPTSVRVLDTSCTSGGCYRGAGQPAHVGSYWELAVKFELFGSKGFYRAPVPISVLSFEILFVDGNTSSNWVPASMLPAEGNFELLSAADTIGLGATAWFSTAAVPTAVRYAHGDFPIGIVHNLEGLPVGEHSHRAFPRQF